MVTNSIIIKIKFHLFYTIKRVRVRVRVRTMYRVYSSLLQLFFFLCGTF